VSSISAIVADDHRVLREGVAQLLGQQPGIHITGQAESGEKALELVLDVHPDVALLDVEMGGMSGIETARFIAERAPGTHTVILSMHRNSSYVAEALGAGASAYVVKDCTLEELVTAIRAAAAGERYLSPSVVGAVVDTYVRDFGGRNGECSAAALTPRETQVLVMTAEGHSVKRIASLLGLSGKTVDAHRRRVMERIGVDSVAGLVKFAIREGLTTAD